MHRTALALPLAALLGCSAASTDAPDTTSDDLTSTPACLGPSSALVLSNGLPYASARVNDVTSGMFLIDLATTRSTIDLSVFDIRPTATGCDSNQLGQSCTFDAFALFGDWGQVSLRTADHSDVHGSVREAGILGTDFLSVVALTLDYRRGRAYHAAESSFCTDTQLTAAGLVALDTSGYFGSDLSKLKPGVPNVPTVPVAIAGAEAVAQLDTGFDDSLVPFSVNVNEAFFDAVPAGTLIRAAGKDLTLSTCVGINEPVEAYTLASGSTFDVGTVGHFGNAVIFVKRTPAAARSCGGIGTWSEPAAQIGTSFFRDLGKVVFDPFGARVWAKPKR